MNDYEYSEKDLIVGEGQYEIYLNLYLLKSQKITSEKLKTIKSHHEARIEIFKIAYDLTNCSEYKGLLNKEIALKIIDSIEKIEFKLQELWGFNIDIRYHTWWYKLPGCECGIIKNSKHFGTKIRYINPKCHFHKYVVESEKYKKV
jgi:hypothetical protein